MAYPPGRNQYGACGTMMLARTEQRSCIFWIFTCIPREVNTVRRKRHKLVCNLHIRILCTRENDSVDEPRRPNKLLAYGKRN